MAVWKWIVVAVVALVLAALAGLGITFRPGPRHSCRHRRGRAYHLLKTFVSGLDPQTVFAGDAGTPRHSPPAARAPVPGRSQPPNTCRCIRRWGCSTAAPTFHDGIWLCGAGRDEAALSPEERRRSAEDAEDAAAVAGDCRPRRGRAGRSRAQGCARSCFRGAGVAAVPPHPRGRGGARRQGDCRALRARHRRRHATVRLLHDQVDDQRADRRSHPARPDFAVACRRRSRNGAARTIRAARSRSSISCA